MKALDTIPFAALALAAALSAPALADPAPAPTPQGQIMAGPGDGAGRTPAPDNFSFGASNGGVVAPPQTAAPQPMDSASGLATGKRQHLPVVGAQPQGISETNQILDVAAPNPQTGGAGNVGQFAESGRKAEASVAVRPLGDTGTHEVGHVADTNLRGGKAPQGKSELAIETLEVANTQGSSIRKKNPRRKGNGRRGRRMHKP